MSRPLPAPTVPFLPDVGIAHAVWAEVATETDARQTVEQLRDWNPDWVVVDSYAFGSEWHDAVRHGLGCRIGAIDDLADRNMSVDLLVDHNYAPDHRAKYRTRLSGAALLLGGPSYALLGPEYADAPRYGPREDVLSIGLFMGGVDQGDISPIVLEAIERAGFTGPVEVVTTSANPHLEKLKARAAYRSDTRLSVDLDHLAGFFARHDLQIGAGGGATWERCCIGAPTLLLMIADNQRAVVPELAAQGIVATVQPLDALDAEAIAVGISDLLSNPARRAQLAERSRGLVDGRGASRVAEAMT